MTVLKRAQLVTTLVQLDIHLLLYDIEDPLVVLLDLLYHQLVQIYHRLFFTLGRLALENDHLAPRRDASVDLVAACFFSLGNLTENVRDVRLPYLGKERLWTVD